MLPANELAALVYGRIPCFRLSRTFFFLRTGTDCAYFIDKEGGDSAALGKPLLETQASLPDTYGLS